MPAVVTTLIAAASAGATVGTFLVYLRFVRRAGREAAREEALALAETRAEVIRDLRGRLASLERRHGQMEASYEAQLHDLRRQLDDTRAEAREQAFQMQRLYTAALVDLLGDLRDDLETVPPNVERALVRIRQLLVAGRPAA